MASKRGFTEEDFSCPVCRDVFKNPVIMKCSHSVCRACLDQFWETKGHRECPVCRKRISNSTPPSNLALKNLCETFLQERNLRASAAAHLCARHNQKLEVFCVEDLQPVCVACRDSAEHSNHNFTPIDGTTAGQYKEKMRTLLDELEKHIQTHPYSAVTCGLMANHIMTQARNTEQQIKVEFEKLHQFLLNEEAARIAALREEEEQKSQMMKEKISSPPATIRAIAEQMDADDITFLQNYKSTVERAHHTLQNLKEDSGALINVAKHLGNLKFRVWKKMQETVDYTPVTFDPNTAQAELVLSEDLTSVTLGNGKQQLPDNPERFDFFPNVLASEGFDSGTHCWDVDVEDVMDWTVGVMEEPLDRKKCAPAKTAHCSVECRFAMECAAYSPTQDHPFRDMSQMLRRIRVQLDYDCGTVSFSDPDTNTRLYTLTHAFTKRVFPFVQCLCNVSVMKILPVHTEVRVEPLQLT
ncbi:zinc-binding protein A33-like [Sardina pilchardus]|uniref:zinc-binding protein A33-like n=1 Tax=Sardina pilchardus TaxID=27697 RepID=UPI002E1471E9